MIARSNDLCLCQLGHKGLQAKETPLHHLLFLHVIAASGISIICCYIGPLGHVLPKASPALQGRQELTAADPSVKLMAKMPFNSIKSKISSNIPSHSPQFDGTKFHPPKVFLPPQKKKESSCGSPFASKQNDSSKVSRSSR